MKMGRVRPHLRPGFCAQDDVVPLQLFGPVTGAFCGQRIVGVNAPHLPRDRARDQPVIGIAQLAEVILDDQRDDARDAVDLLAADVVFGAQGLGLPWGGRGGRGKAVFVPAAGRALRQVDLA